MVDAIVRVNEDVAKRLDLPNGADATGGVVVHLGESNERFPDDLEVPFHGLPKNAISFILLLRKTLD